MNKLKRRLGRKKYHQLKKVVRRVAVLLLLIICIAAVVIWDNGRRHREAAVENTQNKVDNEGEKIYYDNQWYRLKDNLETVLIMGEDKFEAGEDDADYVNTRQTDFLLLLILDKTNQSSQILQLNRDTMTDIESYGVAGKSTGTFTGQLALAHTYGTGGKDSCRNTVKAVSNLLYGVSIDHYLSLTMDAVPIINDAVGGVTVTVLDDMTSADPALEKGAEVTLQGKQALTYVRTRRGLDDSTNLHRMERQRQYMGELYKGLINKLSGDDGFAADLILSINDNLTSDCTASQLQNLGEFLGQCPAPTIDTIDGENVKGEEFMEFYPDESQLRQYVIDHFYEPTDGTQSDSVSETE